MRDLLLCTLTERSKALGDHNDDVALLAREVAHKLCLSSEEVDEVVRAAELHDVGKLALPDAILFKPGALSDEEWETMRLHTTIGQRILAASPALASVGRLVRSTHERWDGAGYPDQLHGEHIPLGARIVAVCDAFAAMITDRPYRNAITRAVALAELERCAGTQFDPTVIDAFLAVIADRRSDITWSDSKGTRVSVRPEPATSGQSPRHRQRRPRREDSLSSAMAVRAGGDRRLTPALGFDLAAQSGSRDVPA
jgi:HD-GYP domain-containing protein (c-di-GMP phosphodiesterase class II)